MAIVAAFELEALKLWFWSNDHEPPHFHAVRRGEWEVKVHFLLEPAAMIETVWAEKDPLRKSLKALAALAEQHRVELLQQWESLHQP